MELETEAKDNNLNLSDAQRLGRDRFGRLTIQKYNGKQNGERTYLCQCVCGETVVRTVPQLQIKRLQTCISCRDEYVERTLERKRQDREKRTKHADYQSTSPPRPEAEEPQE